MDQHVVVITSEKDYSTAVIGPFGTEAAAEDYLANGIELDARSEGVVVPLENPGE